VSARTIHARARIRTRRPAVALLAALVGVVLLASPAWAHDELLTTTPTAGQTVPTVPPEVVLTFAEPPLGLGLAVQITGPDGSDLAGGHPTLADSTVHQAIRSGAPPGTYTVRWRITADDGHPVTGQFAFTATTAGGSAASAGVSPAGTAAAVPVANSTASSSVLWWVAPVALLLLAGALLAGTTVRRRRREVLRRAPEGALDG
jgi:methionine-rich copper-binding protein CopC